MTKNPTNDPGSPPPTSPRTRRLLFLLCGAVVCLAAAVVFFAFQKQQPATDRVAAHETLPPVEAQTVPPTTLNATAAARPSTLIAVNEQPMWASPTDGLPLDLAYLPPGVQIVAALRPPAWTQHPEGEKVLAALGPLGRRGLEAIEQATGRPLAELDQLLVGWQTNQVGDWEVAIVARVPREPMPNSESPSLPPSALHVPPWRRYEPPGHEGRVFVVASPAAIDEIKALDGRAPPLRRAMQRLVDASDRTRDFTLLVAPSFLFGDGHTLFTGETARLRGPLAWFLGDGLTAASLSMHWDQNFFVEFRAVPTLDTPTDEVAERFLQRVHELPDAVEVYVAGLNPSPFSRSVVARLPAMVGQLAAHTRAAYDGDEAVLRAYLPVVAGHNLLMGAELTLAEPPPARPLQRPGSPVSIAERLQNRTTLRFPRDTLEAALDMLAQDLGVEIILLGRDLQLEGITKNQSFGLDLADRPAQEILVEILRQANPDKSASGPADERQRLVYVIKPREPGQPEAIFVTTRSQARQRGDQLPAVFVVPIR